MQKLTTLATTVAGLVLLLATTATLHSNAAASPANDDKTAIKALYKEFNDAFNKKDASGVMAVYAKDVFVYDVVPPRQYATWDAYKKDWESVFSMFPGPVSNTISDLNITVVGPVAYTHYVADGTLTGKDGAKSHLVVRSTDVLRKSNGKWQIVQEHNSVPVDLSTGQPDLLSKP
jgi:uncharacterized protein (TIGR02246 family)